MYKCYIFISHRKQEKQQCLNMEYIIINDYRDTKAFTGKTFSGFKKTQVIKELVESILYNKIEDACYWCFELLFAGHYIDLWETIFHIMSVHIHCGNPKLPIYISVRSNEFKQIINQHTQYQELDFRNNKNIRHIFLEIMIILCYSDKKHEITYVKLNDDALNISELGRLLMATSTNYCKPFFRFQDPKEIYIPVNEFAYHISRDSCIFHKATYWVEWLFHFDTMCKKRKTPVFCETRNYIDNPKLSNDIIWILWDSILNESKQRDDSIMDKIIRSLLSLFCLRMSQVTKKKRRHLFYFAILLLCDCKTTNINITDCDDIQSIVKKTTSLLQKIKQNEIHVNPEEQLK
jgi:hypothetical protein